MSITDPRLAFLDLACARWLLVEVGEMDLATAFADLVPIFREITAPCTCDREMLRRWEQLDGAAGRSRPRRQQQQRRAA